MTEGKTQGRRLVDLFFYAPAGLVQSAAEEFEKLAEKGRHRVEGQLHAARLVGQFAVQTARRQADELVKSAFLRVTGARVEDVDHDGTEGAQDAASAAEPSSESLSARDASSGPGSNGVAGNGTTPTDLAIPGYDSLSASQVVQRLDGLSREELEDVRGHEFTHRHRRTILNRVDQLLNGDGTTGVAAD